ncbi:MAG: hypothetical protein U5L96_12650 [Owenweeksia sp.]|nr:hypothetical protein [Owenweeksia sp.]
MRTAESDLKDIKEIMERSSRFISLSGLSGVFAGGYALLGARITKQYLLPDSLEKLPAGYAEKLDQGPIFVAVALSVLVLSVLTAIFFTTRNARKKIKKYGTSARCACSGT